MSDIRRKLNLVVAGLLVISLLAAVVGCQQATPTDEPAVEQIEAPTEPPAAEPGEPSGEGITLPEVNPFEVRGASRRRAVRQCSRCRSG
jgi:hypothetical protein